MTWTEEMSVGVKALDDDHKKLVGMVNELHDGILERHRQEALGHVLDQLVKYTKIHFSREEELFARTGYPAAAEGEIRFVSIEAAIFRSHPRLFTRRYT